MIVADTNFIAYLFIKGDYSDDARAVFKKDPKWIAPLLWRSEFRNVLSLYMRKEFMDLSQALRIMHEAEYLMRAMEYSVPSMQVLSLTAQLRCPAYDCEFIALAHELDLKLISSDKLILSEFPSLAVHMSDFA